MQLGVVLQCAGLILDILGIALIFFFGIPPRIDPTGADPILAEEENESEKRLGLKYIKLGNAGLGLLIFGFALQFAGLLLISQTPQS